MGNTLLPTWEKTGNTDSSDAATADVWNAAVTTATAVPATWVMPPRDQKPAVASSSAASVAAAILWFAASSWRSTASKNLPSYLVSWLAAVDVAPSPSSSRRSSSELLLLPLAVDAANGLQALPLPCRTLLPPSLHHQDRLARLKPCLIGRSQQAHQLVNPCFYAFA